MNPILNIECTDQNNLYNRDEMGRSNGRPKMNGILDPRQGVVDRFSRCQD